LPDVAPVRASPAEISGSRLLSRLSVGLARGATVGQVNAALAKVSATGIAYARPGLPFLTVIVPAQPDGKALDALAATLRAQPGILVAAGGLQAEPQVLPGRPARHELPEPGGSPLDPAFIEPLAAAHFPAVWNVRGLAGKDCQDHHSTVLVPDLYFGSSPQGFETHVPGAVENFTDVPLVPLNPAQEVLHGYEVLSVLAGQFDVGPPVGANPLPECLDIFPVDVSGTDILQVGPVIENAIVARNGAKVVLNYSAGFGNKLCGPKANAACITETDIAEAADPLKQLVALRAAAAIQWAPFAAEAAVRDTVLIVVAGGNEKVGDPEQGNLGLHYPGFRDALLASEFGYATQLGDLRAILSESARWSPDSPTLPVLQLEANVIDGLVAAQAAIAPTPAPTVNLTLVGSTSVDGKTPSVFSDDHTDLFASGEDVTSVLGQVAGTSFAAPQVAGLV
jgi:hypothetical protein